jgi:hypothetical protein
VRSDPDAPSPPVAAGIAWIRKRDGQVVSFDAGRIAASLLAAGRQLDPSQPAFEVQELTRAVLHFLEAEYAGRIPTTTDVGQTLLQVLRGMGRIPIADAWEAFRDHRDRLRDRLRVRGDRESDVGPSLGADLAASGQANPAPSSFLHPATLPESEAEAEAEEETASFALGVGRWDRRALIDRLSRDTDLDPATIRETAGAVERRLLATGFHAVTEPLIDEMLRCELIERGVERSLPDRRPLALPADEIRRVMESAFVGESAPAESIERRLGGAILRRFARSEVFSPDIVALIDDGLLLVEHLDQPAAWSAVSIDGIGLAATSPDADGYLAGLLARIERLRGRVAGLIAIDAFDGPLATLMEKREPEELADRFAESLVGAVGGPTLLFNLHGGVPPAVARPLTEGSLFAVRPNERHDRLAAAFAQRFAERVLTSDRLRPFVRIDVHPDVRYSADELRSLLRPWTRWIAARGDLRFVFDRGDLAIGEGLRRSSGQLAAQFTAIGIRLDRLRERLGPLADEVMFAERLQTLTESAVRAGLQQREFLRRIQPDLFAGRDRDAAISLVPCGLASAVQGMLGHAPATDDAALAFVVQLLGLIKARAERASRSSGAVVRLDSFARVGAPMFAAAATSRMSGFLAEPVVGNALESAPLGSDVGLSLPGVDDRLWKRLLRAAGTIHRLAGDRGTLFVDWLDRTGTSGSPPTGAEPAPSSEETGGTGAARGRESPSARGRSAKSSRGVGTNPGEPRDESPVGVSNSPALSATELAERIAFAAHPAGITRIGFLPPPPVRQSKLPF